MTDLNEQKLQAEIRLLEAERKAVVLRTRLDIVKGCAVAVGAAAIFWFVQNPDSIVNREASKDSVARERAALILDCLKENDPERRRQALAVVRAVYGRAEDEWLAAVEMTLQEQAASDAELRQAREALKTTQDQHLRKLYRTKQELAKRLRDTYQELAREQEGTAGSRIPGSGPLYHKKRRMVGHLQTQLALIEREIRDYQERQREAPL
jgi:hypothetical protein